LTDANGVMDVGVEISGDLDDPKFDLGGIVWQAFRNVLVKAATAPFRLLAGLVGRSDSLGHVDFAPGEETLDETARGKLASLKEALEKRPALRLGVIGRTDPAADGDVLKQRFLQASLQREAKLDDDELAERGRAWRRAVEKAWE